MHNIFYETNSLIIQKYSIEDLEVNFMVGPTYIHRTFYTKTGTWMPPTDIICLYR